MDCRVIDSAYDALILEDILEIPHCETKHYKPMVHSWAGDCTHEVVAHLSYCEGYGGICQNTVTGIQEIPLMAECPACGSLVVECWKVTPV